MKEHPILFSGLMVKAIMDGRKTQTRRVISPQPRTTHYKPCPGCKEDGRTVWHFFDDGLSSDTDKRTCPYGDAKPRKRDRLWVRECFYIDNSDYVKGPLPKTRPDDLNDEDIYFRADGECCQQIPECACAEYKGKTPWRPSIFLPRWASRITLEITEVRVERLQEISVEAIIAEGLSTTLREHDAVCDLQEQWQNGWNKLNAKRFPWSLNPWVWVIEFKQATDTGQATRAH